MADTISRGASEINYKSWALWTFAVMALITGTTNVLLISLLQNVQVPPCEGCAPVNVTAPFTQHFCSTLGDLLCLLVYQVDIWISRKRESKAWLDYQEQRELPPFRPLIWLFPAIVDSLSGGMMYYAYTLKAPATVQILRNFVLVFCAIFSLTYLKHRLRIAEYVGVVFITLGVFLTTWSPYSVEAAGTNDALSVGLSFCSAFGTALQIAVVEKITRQYHCNPFRSIGWIGVWGSAISGLFLVVAHFTELERCDVTWYQLAHDSVALGILLAFVLSNCIFTLSGLMITNFGAGLLTATISTLRHVPIYLVSLCLGIHAFVFFELFGLLSCVLGFLVYTQLFWSHCCLPRIQQIMRKQVVCRCDLEDDSSFQSSASTKYSFAPVAGNVTVTVDVSPDPAAPPKSAIEWTSTIRVTDDTGPASTWIYVRRSESTMESAQRAEQRL